MIRMTQIRALAALLPALVLASCAGACDPMLRSSAAAIATTLTPATNSRRVITEKLRGWPICPAEVLCGANVALPGRVAKGRRGIGVTFR